MQSLTIAALIVGIVALVVAIVALILGLQAPEPQPIIAPPTQPTSTAAATTVGPVNCPFSLPDTTFGQVQNVVTVYITNQGHCNVKVRLLQGSTLKTEAIVENNGYSIPVSGTNVNKIEMSCPSSITVENGCHFSYSIQTQ